MADNRPPTDEPPTGQSPKFGRNDDMSFHLYVTLNVLIMESSIIVFTMLRMFMLFKFTRTVHKNEINKFYIIFYTYIFYFLLYFSCLNGRVAWQLYCRLWAWNGLPLNTYISIYDISSRCYNERGSRTNYVPSSILHCIFTTAN